MNPPLQQRAFRRILVAASALIILLLIGIMGYRWLEGMDTIDALYMVVITISTVGFGEVKPLSQTGRLFTVGLIIAGAGLAAYTVGGLAEFVLSGDWRAQWEHQRRLRMLAQLTNHIIVCGFGRVGRFVAHELKAEGLPFVVIDLDPSKITRIQEAGYLALQGNAANENHLRAAGIERARSLIVAANSDAENVFIVLTARSLRSDLFIIARANFEESEQKLVRAGSDRVILPYRIAGRRMVTMLVRSDVADFLDEVAHASGLELILEQMLISPTSPLVGQTLAQAQLRKRLGVTVLAYKLPDGQLNTRVGIDMVLEANMQIIALGTRQDLQIMIKLAQGS